MTLFCTSGHAILKAGENLNEHFYSGCASLRGGLSGNTITHWISGATCKINSLMRYNFSDNYDNLNGDVKYILNELAADMVGIEIVKYDMSGYTSRVEAEDIINVLRDDKLMMMSILRDKETQGFVNNPAVGSV